jgi:nitrogen-specific signal transduction histidine kinase
MLFKFGQTQYQQGGSMIDVTLMAAILDSLKDPLLFADTEHMTRYMNKAATTYYEEGASLIGRSLLDCHNQQSQQMMIDILAAMQAEGIEEQLITDNEKHRIYMRAVRDPGGQVLGYYERYEPPTKR